MREWKGPNGSDTSSAQADYVLLYRILTCLQQRDQSNATVDINNCWELCQSNKRCLVWKTLPTTAWKPRYVQQPEVLVGFSPSFRIFNQPLKTWALHVGVKGIPLQIIMAEPISLKSWVRSDYAYFLSYRTRWLVTTFQQSTIRLIDGDVGVTMTSTHTWITQYIITSLIRLSTPILLNSVEWIPSHHHKLDL